LGRRRKRRRRRNRRYSKRHHIRSGGGGRDTIFYAMKITGLCPLVLLVKMGWKQYKTLGREGKVMRCGLFWVYSEVKRMNIWPELRILLNFVFWWLKNRSELAAI
jgi:hypothetical protein